MTLSIHTIGTGQPMVLLHGWGFDHQIWMPWVTRLIANMDEKHYQFYLVDLPGFGQSPDMLWEAFKTKLFDQLPEQFTLMGWSMGGMVATRLAFESPERISRVINVASSPRFTATTGWLGVAAEVLDEFYQRFLNNPKRTQQHFIRTQLQGQSLPSTLLQIHAGNEGLKRGLELLKHWDLREKLLTIRMPVTYIFGRLDALIPYQVVEIMQQQYPNFNYFMLEKSAHIPFLSHSDEFTACLRTI